MKAEFLRTVVDVYDALYSRKLELLDEIKTAYMELGQINEVIAEMAYELKQAGEDVRWRYCDRETWTGKLVRLDDGGDRREH